jgi:small subunit ribosomal protein S16
MSVKIRLARYGAKKRPYYRIVAASTEAPRDGRFLELLGTYDPSKSPVALSLKHERLKAWIDRGAIPTPTVNSLLKKEGFFSETTGA